MKPHRISAIIEGALIVVAIILIAIVGFVIYKNATPQAKSTQSTDSKVEAKQEDVKTKEDLDTIKINLDAESFDDKELDQLDQALNEL